MLQGLTKGQCKRSLGWATGWARQGTCLSPSELLKQNDVHCVTSIQHTFISHSPGNQKFKVEVSTNSVSDEGLLTHS